MTEAEKKAAAMRVAASIYKGSAEQVVRKHMVDVAADHLLKQRAAGALPDRQAELVDAAQKLAEHMNRAEHQVIQQAAATEKIRRERERTAPNKYENRFFMDLMILRNTLLSNMDRNRDRLKKAGRYCWRDARLMLTLVQKTMDRLLDTMPESRLDYYDMIRKHGRYVMTLEGPVRQAREVVITDVRLGTITDAAIRGECGLCLKEGREVERCPLRDALLEIAPPTEIKSGYQFGCEYRDASRQLDAGEDVEI